MACLAAWLPQPEDMDSESETEAFFLIAKAVSQTQFLQCSDEGPTHTFLCSQSSIPGAEHCIKKKQIFYTEQ